MSNWYYDTSSVSHLEDDGADESVDRPGERFRDPGSLKTPQHDPPLTEDGEEVQHLCQTPIKPKLRGTEQTLTVKKTCKK